MKKLTLHTIFVLFCLGIFAQGNDRNVIWIHGLDGGEHSWKHYEQIFSSERKINSLRKAYNSGIGINGASNHLRGIINQNLGSGATDSRNIGIGHSMGGLIARNIDRTTSSGQKHFGGIITVATPNHGAQIANSLSSGALEAAANNAFQQLWAGPQAQSFASAWMFPSFTGIMNFHLSPQKVAELLLWYADLHNAYGTQTSNNDLMVGSAAINTINASQHSIPVISMWARENSPVHWRLLSSHVLEKRGQAPNDQQLVTYMNRVREHYNIKYHFFMGAAANGFLPGLYIANQWKKGRDWIDNSERIWNTITGAREVTTATYTSIQFICNHEIPALDPHERWYNDEVSTRWQDCITIVNTTTQTVIRNLPSDGLIKKDSQIISGLPTNNIYEIKNANHFSVRNMSYKGSAGNNTYKELDKVWRRRTGDFFRTDQR